jgi:trk system potassium uptake protein TrkA
MEDNQRFVLIGMGPFGREIAMTLNENNADLIVMDKDPNVISQMKSTGFKYAVHIDNLDPASLAKFIKPEDVVILSLGDDFESNILTIEILKEIGVKSIYSRATKDIQYKVLEKMDISEILFPEKQEGRRFALKLLNRDIHFIDEFAEDIFLVEVPVTNKLVGKTIVNLEIRSKYNVNIIGLKSTPSDSGNHGIQRMDYVGFENTVLKPEHSLLVIGKETDLEELIKDTKPAGRNKD